MLTGCGEVFQSRCPISDHQSSVVSRASTMAERRASESDKHGQSKSRQPGIVSSHSSQWCLWLISCFAQSSW